MENVKKYRYPGINSFETTDTDIFFGREDDRKKLADLVEREKNVLVYSRSGLGKSSLLKAGLMPELSDRGYQSYYIRLGLYQEGSLSPVKTVLRRTILNEQKLPDTFLQKFINRNSSLWYAFKSLQIFQTQHHQQHEKPVLLIFDQFEEIASYRARHLTEFKQQLAELLYTPIPKDYSDALKDDHLLLEPLTDEELDLFYKPLRIKVVFAIRSDQLSILNKLSDYLPNILKVYYELKALSADQAKSAIVEPARKQGSFLTPSFEYDAQALEKISGSLTSEKTNDVDTAQLQILLQYIEQDIVEKRNDTLITADDLGDLNKVYENYYRNSLSKLKSEQKQAQILIEEKLIADERRISLDKALCLKEVSEDTLNALIETRLLRQEPNTMGGFSYEVSHDSLIPPILDARDKRKRQEEEENRIKEYEALVEAQRKKQHQQRIRLILVTVVLLVSIGFGIYAATLLTKVKEEKRKTQEALKKSLETEIGRKNLELGQVSNEINTYTLSGDSVLIQYATLKGDTLRKQIDSLNAELIKN